MRALAVLVGALAIAGCSSERDVPDAGGPTGIHPALAVDTDGDGTPDYQDTASDDFHGKDLARRGYDLNLCAKCHGKDFDGGTAERSCLTCHPRGPDACDTCHREGTMSGAHAVHELAGQACGECHRVPATWDAAGHVLQDPPPAELAFGARASTTLDPADRAGPPAYVDGTCSNMYCHGDVLAAGGGSKTDPRWDDTPAIGACDTCHAAPPPSHSLATCATCHPTPAPQTTLHVDGIVQFGDECDSCHGDAQSPAPPRDLAGNTFTTELGVGAHRAHLFGPAKLRGPVACNECHVVPATVLATGHLDSALPAEVFPPGSGTLARADGATPVWDRVTCTNTYCHGGGTKLAADTSPGRITAPGWTSGGQVFCGSCHGLPPTSTPHTPAMTIGDCVTCHATSVDAFGNILFSAGASQHLDGDVDVQ